MTFYIQDDSGFDVGANFDRACGDTPVIRFGHDEYAKPGHCIAYIAGNPNSRLGFMRSPVVRVHVRKNAIIERD
jgi:hypothetical protein